MPSRWACQSNIDGEARRRPVVATTWPSLATSPRVRSPSLPKLLFYKNKNRALSLAPPSMVSVVHCLLEDLCVGLS